MLTKVGHICRSTKVHTKSGMRNLLHNASIFFSQYIYIYVRIGQPLKFRVFAFLGMFSLQKAVLFSPSVAWHDNYKLFLLHRSLPCLWLQSLDHECSGDYLLNFIHWKNVSDIWSRDHSFSGPFWLLLSRLSLTEVYLIDTHARPYLEIITTNNDEFFAYYSFVVSLQVSRRRV